MKKSFGIFIFITPQYCWGAEFIIKKNLLKLSFLFIINISIYARGK